MPRTLRLALISAVCALALALAACGSDGSDGGNAGGDNGGSNGSADGGTGGEPSKWAFLFEGPMKDGGFNESFQLAVDSVESVGDEVVVQDELPYTREFTQAVSRQIGDGSRVLVEALGAGPLFNSCTKSKVPDVKCYTPVTDPENVPENTVGYWQEEWFLQYIGGYAAGLQTKSNITGFVSPFKLPVTYGAINSFALGCRAANPECEVRVVVIESYFDPSKAAKASNTLIDAGADVLSAYVNDPTFCQVAEKRGVFAIGLYTEGFGESCPKAAIASTIYDFTDYFKAEAESIRDGSWKGGVLEWVKVGDGPGSPRLSSLNEDITTPELREKVEAEYQKILDGETPFKGPIKDTKGEVRVPEGETLDDVFLWYGWDWYVEGVVGS